MMSAATPLPFIIPRIEDWPIYQLSQRRDTFAKEVAHRAAIGIAERLDNGQGLHELIAQALYLERVRIKNHRWRIDPKDDASFWENVKTRLAAADTDHELLQGLTNDIIQRYAFEISGRFKPRTYRLADRVAHFSFRQLVKASALRRRKRPGVHDKVRISGPLEHIRELGSKATLVIVPTHFSNLDSLVMGWAIQAIGLPAFLYGAGLNLFNIRFMAYFMNRLGAYKVDRRKKNRIYLETLKAYSGCALEQGIPELFFPGGTRNRAGALDQTLRLGLLGTTVEAQRRLIESGSDRKIIIIPAVINYHFVLEAPLLIAQHLKRVGKERYESGTDKYSTSSRIATFLIKFFSAPTCMEISFGEPLDVLGNRVSPAGQSMNHLGQEVSLRDYFERDGKLEGHRQREHEYTRQLSEMIVDSYRRNNVVMTSHVVAFVAFLLMRKQFAAFDLYEFLKLPDEDVIIPSDRFVSAVTDFMHVVHQFAQEGKLRVSRDLQSPAEEIIRDGLRNVGMYHPKRPLRQKRNGDLYSPDLNLLYYYHNRLTGYGLEAAVQ